MSLLPRTKKMKLQRAWLRGLLVCVIFRALIPLGFMPGSSMAAHAPSWISLCWGNAGSAQLLKLAQANAADSAYEHAHHHHSADAADNSGDSYSSGPRPFDRGSTDHKAGHASMDHGYCLFAGVVFSGATCSDPSVAIFLPGQSEAFHTSTGAYAAPLFTTPPARAPPALFPFV